MPDKQYVKGCGPKCLKCWRNRLKHANPTVKKYMKRHGISSINDAWLKSIDELNMSIKQNVIDQSKEWQT
jgi:hypothetical protein